MMSYSLGPVFFLFRLLCNRHFHFPAQLVGGYTLSDLVDKPWSQVSSLLPRGIAATPILLQQLCTPTSGSIAKILTLTAVLVQ